MQIVIEKFKLKAIIQAGVRPQAMFADPDGDIHILGEGDRIGKERGTISRILNKEVFITEKTLNYLGVESLFERVLSLPAGGLEESIETNSVGSSSSPSPVPRVQSPQSRNIGSSQSGTSTGGAPAQPTSTFSRDRFRGSSRVQNPNGLSTPSERAPRIDRSQQNQVITIKGGQ